MPPAPPCGPHCWHNRSGRDWLVGGGIVEGAVVGVVPAGPPTMLLVHNERRGGRTERIRHVEVTDERQRDRMCAGGGDQQKATAGGVVLHVARSDVCAGLVHAERQ